MQKLREKINANAVGANCIHPHFEEMTLKKQKGITVIALIITIIVMLILVGVTVNVALDGGLFEKADTAEKQTQKEVEKEQLLDAVLGTLDNNGKFNLDNIVLPNGFIPVDSADNTKKVYTGPSGQYYEVSKTTGKVEETESPTTPQEPVEEVSFYGTYTCYNGGESMTLEILEPDEEGNLVATLMGQNGTYTYDADNKTGSILFAALDTEFTFNKKDILDENGNIINICLLATPDNGFNNFIFSKHGGLGATLLTGKSYIRYEGPETKERVIRFDVTNVGELQYGALYEYENYIKEYYVIDGKLYGCMDKTIEIIEITSDYEKITYMDDEYILIKE